MDHVPARPCSASAIVSANDDGEAAVARYALVLALVLTSVSAPALASGSSVCGGLKGAERRACLDGELERGQRELARIERNNRLLDYGKKAVCTVTRSSVAGAAGGALGDAALRQDRPCTPRAR
jgi:hypothetical protein